MAQVFEKNKFFTFRKTDFTHTKYYIFGSSLTHKFGGIYLLKKKKILVHQSDNYLQQFTKDFVFFFSGKVVQELKLLFEIFNIFSGQKKKQFRKLKFRLETVNHHSTMGEHKLTPLSSPKSPMEVDRHLYLLF